MAIVEIYSSMWCPFCYRAKRLLEHKGVDYKEIEVSDNPNLKSEMLSRSDGRYTVPQIFIDGKGIGGSDELVALDQNGKLDAILGLDD